GSKAFGGLHRRLKEKTAESRWFATTGQAPFGRAKAAYWKINVQGTCACGEEPAGGIVKLLTLLPGSFSFRTWDGTTGGKRVQGFVPRRALLSRHAPHAPKLCTQVDHHDSTASAPHRSLPRHS